MSRFVHLTIVPTESEAEIVCALLRTEGIECDHQPTNFSVGSMDGVGIRYGLTTQALIASTIATAPTIVTTQSRPTRQPCGSLWRRRSSG